MSILSWLVTIIEFEKIYTKVINGGWGRRIFVLNKLKLKLIEFCSCFFFRGKY